MGSDVKRNFDLTPILVLIVIGLCCGLIWQGEASRLASIAARDECRAANPGYECARGWVKADPFDPSLRSLKAKP